MAKEKLSMEYAKLVKLKKLCKEEMVKADEKLKEARWSNRKSDEQYYMGVANTYGYIMAQIGTELENIKD